MEADSKSLPPSASGIRRTQCGASSQVHWVKHFGPSLRSLKKVAHQRSHAPQRGQGRKDDAVRLTGYGRKRAHENFAVNTWLAFLVEPDHVFFGSVETLDAAIETLELHFAAPARDVPDVDGFDTLGDARLWRGAEDYIGGDHSSAELRTRTEQGKLQNIAGRLGIFAGGPYGNRMRKPPASPPCGIVPGEMKHALIGADAFRLSDAIPSEK